VLTVAVGEVKGVLSHVELGKDVTYSDAYQGSTGQVVCKGMLMGGTL
jgi:hypothetical protein